MLYVDETPPEGELLRRLYAFAEAGGTLITAPGWEERGESLPRSSFSRFKLSDYGQGRLAVAREELVDPYRLAEDAQALMSHRHDLVRVFNPGHRPLRLLEERGRSRRPWCTCSPTRDTPSKRT